MGKLIVFNFLSLNGYYKGDGGDISWHRHGGEEAEFSKENAQAGGTIVFGRVTYEMMAGFWPTADAAKAFPEVAKGMNESQKIVFSRTLKKATWQNTRIISDNIIDEMRNLKEKSGKDMAILGSGSIVSQFATEGLIDEFQFMIDPVALNSGTPVLKDIPQKIDLTLVKSRVFKSGTVLLCYEPMKK